MREKEDVPTGHQKRKTTRLRGKISFSFLHNLSREKKKKGGGIPDTTDRYENARARGLGLAVFGKRTL